MTEQFGEVRERLGRIELGQERQSDQLAEILRRLPDGQAAKQEAKMITELSTGLHALA